MWDSIHFAALHDLVFSITSFVFSVVKFDAILMLLIGSLV